MKTQHQEKSEAGIRYGIVANSNAGLSNPKTNWARLGEINALIKKTNREVKNQDYITLIITNTIADASSAIVELVVKKKVQVLFVFGGDGTLHQVISLLYQEKYYEKDIRTMPIIVSLGGGTMLAVHSWLGWGRDSTKIFERIIESPIRFLPGEAVMTKKKIEESVRAKYSGASDDPNIIEKLEKERSFEYQEFLFKKCYAALPLREVAPLRILFAPADKNSPDVSFGFMFVIGAITRVMEEYDKEKSIIAGVKHALFGASASIFGWPESHRKIIDNFQAEIVADDQNVGHNRPMSIIASITNTLLPIIKPFRGVAKLGQFYLMSSSLSAKEISWRIPLLFRATVNPPEPAFVNKPVTDLVIKPFNEVEADDLFVDGDFLKRRKNSPIYLKTAPSFYMVERR